MKKSTCKVLIGIGVIVLLLFFVLPIFMIATSSRNDSIHYMALNMLFYSIVGFILIIVGWAKWNSEEEHKEVKEAQLQALRKGKVNVELKGKMRKLK